MAITIAGSNKYLDDTGVVTSISGSFTISAGSQLKLLVFVTYGCTATDVSGMAPTFNGVALTKVTGASGSANAAGSITGCWCYFIDEASLPAAGSYTLTSGTITGVTVSRLRMYVVELNGASTGAPEASALGSYTTSQTNPTQAITTLTNNACVVGCFPGNANTTISSYGAGQTEQQRHDAINLATGVTTETVATAGADTQGITYAAAASRGVLSLVSVAPGGAVTNTRQRKGWPRGVTRAVRAA